MSAERESKWMYAVPIHVFPYPSRGITYKKHIGLCGNTVHFNVYVVTILHRTAKPSLRIMAVTQPTIQSTWNQLFVHTHNPENNTIPDTSIDNAVIILLPQNNVCAALFVHTELSMYFTPYLQTSALFFALARVCSDRFLFFFLLLLEFRWQTNGKCWRIKHPCNWFTRVACSTACCFSLLFFLFLHAEYNSRWRWWTHLLLSRNNIHLQYNCIAFDNSTRVYYVYNDYFVWLLP